MFKKYAGKKEKVVRVGWTYVPDENIPQSLYEDPEKWKNAFTECPASLKLQDHTYSLKAPMDLRMEQKRAADGQLEGVDITDQETKGINLFEEQFIVMDHSKFWSYDNIPQFQINMGFLFFADEDIDIFAMPPFFNQNSPKGVDFIGGTFNIHRWLRPIQIAYKFQTKESIFEMHKYDVLSNIMFSKPAKLEYVPWNDKIDNLLRTTDNLTRFTTKTWLNFKNFKVPQTYFPE